MSVLKMKKGLTLLICTICFAVLLSATRSFAAGDLFGAHCWTGDTSGIFIELQFTRNGPLRVYNVSGSTVSPFGTNPAYGTAFYDNTVNKIKVGYTVVVPGAPVPVNTIYLDLDPNTLNGTKTALPSGISENVGLVSCKVN